MINWTIERRKIKDLFFYEKNPRTLTKDQEAHLRHSLINFGQCEPIVINIDNIIIGGHQRVRTLKKIGNKEVDVCVPSRLLTEKEVEELNIRLNKNTGDFDFDVLANSWNALDLLEWGFTAEELDLDIEKENPKEKKATITIYLDKSSELTEIEGVIDECLKNYQVKIKCKSK